MESFTTCSCIISSLAEVQSCKVSELNITSAVLVTATFCDEVLDVLFADWELQEIGENLLKVGSRDVVLIPLIK